MKVVIIAKIRGVKISALVIAKKLVSFLNLLGLVKFYKNFS